MIAIDEDGRITILPDPDEMDVELVHESMLFIGGVDDARTDA